MEKWFELRLSNQRGSILVMVLAILFVIGILLARMTEQAILDDQLTNNFVKLIQRHDGLHHDQRMS